MKSAEALACAVCFGNPHSLLSKGVVAGVMLLVGVIAAVLLGFLAVALVWRRRAILLEAQAKKGPPAN